MNWSNFSIWRGRLPHWRADDVHYYVTFRHRRRLNEQEEKEIYIELLKPESTQWHLDILCVRPEVSEFIVNVERDKTGRPIELSKIVERAKSRAGKKIIKKTGERFSPFYDESFDRIIRDEVENEELWMKIIDAPVADELTDDPDSYPFLWVAHAKEL